MSFPVLSARYTRIAPDSKSASGLPPGPSGSMIAGIFWYGFNEAISGERCSSRSNATRCGSYGSPVSSRKIATLTPLGVGSE